MQQNYKGTLLELQQSFYFFKNKAMDQIANECFWDDEVLKLFKTFSREEIYLIKYYLDNNDKSYISNSKWELKFLKYLRSYEIS